MDYLRMSRKSGAEFSGQKIFTRRLVESVFTSERENTVVSWNTESIHKIVKRETLR